MGEENTRDVHSGARAGGEGLGRSNEPWQAEEGGGIRKLWRHCICTGQTGRSRTHVRLRNFLRNAFRIAAMIAMDCLRRRPLIV